MEFTGIIHKIAETVQVSATFKKRDIVLKVVNIGKDGAEWPEFPSFQFCQDKCDLLNNYNLGDKVEILFNLKGREWKSPQGEIKYFNTLDAYVIHSDKGEELPIPQAAQPMPTQAAQAAPSLGLVDPVQPLASEPLEDEVPF